MEALRRGGGAEEGRSGGAEEQEKEPHLVNDPPQRPRFGSVQAVQGFFNVWLRMMSSTHRYRNQFLIIEARKTDKSSRTQRQNRGLEIWDDS